MLNEFKAFVARGNVLDLAVAVIIGTAFGKIVASLTDDVLMPIVGKAFGGLDFSSCFVILGPVPAGYAGSMGDYAALRKAGVPLLGYGQFVTQAVDFLILAFIVFLIVRSANRMMPKPHQPEASEPADVTLLREIRDTLQGRPPPDRARSGGGEILGARVGQAGAVEDPRGLVADAHHRQPDRAIRLAAAVQARAVGGAADAGHQRERPLDHPDDVTHRDQMGRPRQPVPAHLAAMTVQEAGVPEVGEDQFQELARHVGTQGDPRHRDRRAARRRLGEEQHRAERVAGTLG